jgi:hypothetical protein
MRLRRPTDTPPSDARLDDYLAAEFDNIAQVVALLVDAAPRETQQRVREHLARKEHS